LDMMPYKQLIAVCFTLLVIFAFLGPVWGQEVERVNINKASVQELAKLKKVGPKYAVRIVEHRQKYGPFKLTEDLMEVPGIGPGTYDRIKDQIIAQ
ncbi:MAG: ComEA family DNA-binding protein, partial [Desulfobacterales bacterium]|nr:ComEA family DNA-binding protein [Desulfobacterales bacterium]